MYIIALTAHAVRLSNSPLCLPAVAVICRVSALLASATSRRQGAGCTVFPLCLPTPTCLILSTVSAFAPSEYPRIHRTQGDDHKAECFADGFSDFLTKPITPQSVRQALGRYAASVAGAAGSGGAGGQAGAGAVATPEMPLV